MAVMAVIPSRPGRADCPSEIAVIEPPHLTEPAVSASTPQNLTNDGDGNPCRIHRPRPSRKLVPFGSEIWSTHQFGKECQPNRGHREAHISPPEADVRSSVNRIALGTIIGEQPWREMLAADKAKVIDLPPTLRARIDLYNSRSHAIDARSPPDVGRLRVVVRQLVPVLRHRQHPHGAERGNHRDIHDNPHGPIPPFTQ